jgi:hypothetical protein
MAAPEQMSSIETQKVYTLILLGRAFDRTGGIGLLTDAVNSLNDPGEKSDDAVGALVSCISPYLDNTTISHWVESQCWTWLTPAAYSEEHRRLIEAKDRAYEQFHRTVLRRMLGGKQYAKDPQEPFSPEEITILLDDGINAGFVLDKGNSYEYIQADTTADFLCQALRNGVKLNKNFTTQMHSVAMSDEMRSDLKQVAVYKLAAMLGWTNQLIHEAKRLSLSIPNNWNPNTPDSSDPEASGIGRLYKDAYGAVVRFGNPDDPLLIHIFFSPRLRTNGTGTLSRIP